MSDAIIVALITIGVPALLGGIAAAWRIARESGRAEEYRRNAELTIEQKNRELGEKDALISDLRQKLEGRP